ncbi:M42 family metallopeptidase [Lapidilactobacillus bayanensis]|uniref:M42 family metallopeptidase n=1 Tax=Lapidilactobacillus bayanensis TaxID=2485998 RepID=UPI000F77E87E|nr:M20/M25/M40 family metallo-hydrolase [Lapidilactobacillus bayanensis]
MKKEKSIQLIQDLSNARGISSFEDEVTALFKDEVKDAGTVTEDHMRNVFVNQPFNSGDRPVVELDAHSDEVGFMIRAIKPNGQMMFVNVGGWAMVTVPAQKVKVRNHDGEWLSGIVSSTPPHFMTAEERTRLPKPDELSIDVGASSAQEVRDVYGIEIGAPVVPDVTCEYNEKSGLFLGKAFDNRIGTALLAATMNDIATEQLDVDVVAGLSSQEEVGDRGAEVVVRKIKPDLAIVFEGAPADDTVMPDYLIQSGLRKGPMLRDFDSTIVTNPHFQRFALDVAAENNIPVQRSVRTGGGQDGAIINRYNGAPTIVISVPVRYAHTPYCFIALEDYQNALELAKLIIKKLNANVLSNF